MGATGIGIPGALHHRETTLIKDFVEAGKPRVKTKRPLTGVATNLQHLTGWNCERRPAAEIERVLIRHDRAQGIVAPAEIYDHETSAAGALG